MRPVALILVLLSPALGEDSLHRKQKFLGLFNVITFPNLECEVSYGAPKVEGDRGICVSTSECMGMDGTVAGSCASGFGSCCVIYSSSCGGTLAHNCTYVRNPGYVNTYTTAGECEWKFPKFRPDVCFIRLDFDVLTLASPATTGYCGATDYFQGLNAAIDVTRTVETTGRTANLICGENAGMHIYLDAGPQSTTKDASLKAVLVGSTTERKWKFKVTQILCGDLSAPPQGCWQYYTGVQGTVRSANFDGRNTDGNYMHLADQYYRVCIRRERGYCKISWAQSTDTDSFKLSRPSTNYKSDTLYGSQCAPDHIRIVGGSNDGDGRCATAGTPATAPAPNVDRYCGGTLNCNYNSVSKSTIVSERLPFELGVNFNPTESAGTNNRGFCLHFAQILCSGD